MKNRILLTLILLLFSSPLFAVPITYYNLDFEDGSFGGGYTFSGFGSAQNIISGQLDGRALSFDLNDQMVWDRNNLDSDYHYVSFDYYAEAAANITHFLDVPSILRSDVDIAGRHKVELYYDFSEEVVTAFLDGIQYNDMVSIEAWPITKSSKQIRLANQQIGPGFSKGRFEIDNLIWQGDVQLERIPEPAVLLLLSLGLFVLGIAYKQT